MARQGPRGHHGNLGDIYTEGRDGAGCVPLLERLERIRQSVSYAEAVDNLPEYIREKIDALIDGQVFYNEFKAVLNKINRYGGGRESNLLQISLLTRYLHSCLIDADRSDAADFKDGQRAQINEEAREKGFDKIRGVFEREILALKVRYPIDKIRRQISDECMHNLTNSTAYVSGRGILKLSVPTGGGKTFLSNRIAFLLAEKHGKDRVINFAPFISIIEQNAAAISDKLETEDSLKGKAVLEHHSNFIREKDDNPNGDYIYGLLTESWNSRVVFTSTVQFFDSVYSGQSENNRRMHALANSVIIFDEVQTVPLKTYFLFNAAAKFLTEVCNSIIILSTATQPILDNLNLYVDKSKVCESITVPSENHLLPDIDGYLCKLKRVSLQFPNKAGGYSEEEIADLL